MRRSRTAFCVSSCRKPRPPNRARSRFAVPKQRKRSRRLHNRSLEFTNRTEPPGHMPWRFFLAQSRRKLRRYSSSSGDTIWKSITVSTMWWSIAARAPAASCSAIAPAISWWSCNDRRNIAGPSLAADSR